MIMDASELRQIVRSLGRSPAFVAVSVATLATGVAAIATIFSFANAIYLRPLPYPEADRTIAIGEERPSVYPRFSAVSRLVEQEILSSAKSFERLAVYEAVSARSPGWTRPNLVLLRIDTSFVPLFDLRAQLGRVVSPEEIAADAPVMMISDDLWRSRFGMDSGALHARLTVLDREYRIVGVLPARFQFPGRTDGYVPLAARESRDDRRETLRGVIARFRTGVPRAQAQAEITTIATRLRARDSKSFRGLRLVLREEMLERSGNRYLPKPAFFLIAASLVFLVACSNVGTLSLVRSARRERELAIRAALGARPLQLARLALIESLLIGTVAAIAGTVLSVWFVRVALSVLPTQGLPSWIDFRLDVRGIVLGVLMAFLIAVVVGISPAKHGARLDVLRSLSSSRGAGGWTRKARRRLERGPAVQVAVAVLLAVVTTLLWRSYAGILNADVGYDAQEILGIGVSPAAALADEHQRTLDEAVGGIKSVRGVSIVATRGYYERDRVPTRRGNADSAARNNAPVRIFVDGDTTVRVATNTRLFVVSEDYFRLLGLQMIRGRALARTDGNGTMPVVVVSQRFAESTWPNTDPLGRRLQIGQSGREYSVVGIVEDVKDLQGGPAGLRPTRRPDVYFADSQAVPAQTEVLFRGSRDVRSLGAAGATKLAVILPTATLSAPQTMASQFDESLFVTRILGLLLGTFAAATGFLAMLGVFGVTAFSVAQRSKEIGIRMAIGGTRQAIAAMILRDGIIIVATGAALGIALSLAITGLLRAILVGTSPLDPVAYIMACGLFAVLTLLACIVPARRAMLQQPVVALRAE